MGKDTFYRKGRLSDQNCSHIIDIICRKKNFHISQALRLSSFTNNYISQFLFSFTDTGCNFGQISGPFYRRCPFPLTLSFFCCIDYMAGWARRYEGEIIPSDRPRESIFLFKKAIGVTTGILPWNFPFFLVARKAAPALITGNTIVVKPSQLTPENAYVFAQIVEEVGLPAGVFNLVNGRGSVIGHELAANPKVGMVSLTGSVSAGQQTMAAAAPNITKVSLELGGKAPAIVMEDADIDLAVKSIIASRVINTGQVCNCAERVYVDKKIKDIFMEKLVAGMKQVKVGNPNEIADLDMGPLIEANALAAMEQKVEKAVRQGAKLLCGGHRIGTKGYFFEPTVLDCATQEMDIIREETFGPILPIVYVVWGLADWLRSSRLPEKFMDV